MVKLAILISGRGSNMIRLAETISKAKLDARICIVISNKPCDGISHAAALDIPTKIIEKHNFDNRDAHDAAIRDAIITAGADYVFLAGYMAILGAEFTAHFAGKLINIHPSLLPSFKGLDTHQRALDANAAQHGATVHLVTATLDDGPIILQAQLTILPDDNADSLAARVLRLEHQLYPFVLKSLIAGQVTLSPSGVIWHQPRAALHSADAETQEVLSSALCWPTASNA